jgi:uncharacterized NAD(P)/FAD-binding protein YdhS
MGRGVAYSTTEAVHLLNVCAEGMSAWAHDPDHFANWFGTGASYAEGFAPRRLFAKYLGEILNEAVSSGCTELIEATVVSGTREAEGWRIGFDDGPSVHADVVVLATGNQEPDALRAFENVGPPFIRNPWGADARAAVQELTVSGEAALIVGTGLTMVDLVLSLDAAGHRGRIVALSRRGLAPRGHVENDPAPVEADEVPHGSVRALSHWLRHRGAEMGWRAAIDSLRPHSHSLWQSLDTDQQRRFLRHARPWWDVHRHRIAPEVAATIVRLVSEGRLEIVAGRIVSARDGESGLNVEFRRRGSDTVQTERFAYAFNCTGPLHSMARTKDPLLRSLLDAGAITPDHLGIGLEVDGTCRAGEHLWAMGPLTKGRYWEIIAVPDIRDQAAMVADDIQRELGA